MTTVCERCDLDFNSSSVFISHRFPITKFARDFVLRIILDHMCLGQSSKVRVACDNFSFPVSCCGEDD
jgi:hypothetical protein